MDQELNSFFKKQLLRISTKKQNVFFISDLHLNNKNVVSYSHRPFNDIEEMNEFLIKSWNGVIQKDDTVFILGDFCFGGSQVWNDILDRLNGKKYLIIGNHDERNFRQNYLSRFEAVSYMMHIYIDDQSIYLTHFPFLCYAGSYKDENGSWALSGHVHFNEISDGRDDERVKNFFPTQYDVGVDANYYMPVSFNDVKNNIDQQKYLGVNQYDIIRKTKKYYFRVFLKKIEEFLKNLKINLYIC